MADGLAMIPPNAPTVEKIQPTQMAQPLWPGRKLISEPLNAKGAFRGSNVDLTFTLASGVLATALSQLAR